MSVPKVSATAMIVINMKRRNQYPVRRRYQVVPKYGMRATAEARAHPGLPATSAPIAVDSRPGTHRSGTRALVAATAGKSRRLDARGEAGGRGDDAVGEVAVADVVEAGHEFQGQAHQVFAGH